GQGPRPDQENWLEYIGGLNQSLPDFFGPQTLPMKPVAVDRTIAEWEPVRALLVSISLRDALREPRVFGYYLTLIKAASSFVEVGILYGAQDRPLVERFIKRIEESGIPSETMDRLHFIDTPEVNFWLRDNGPVFGLGQNGGLLVYDNIYRPLMPELEAWKQSPIDVDSRSLEQDDQAFEDYKYVQRRIESTPLYVSKFIRELFQVDSLLVRPPLHLQGGDYMTDGQGRIFVSEDTVLENGGDKDNLERIFRDYYGADEVYILNALPGIAAKHLDLLMKLIDPNTLLLSEPPALATGTSRANKRLIKDIGIIQQANEDYLKRNYPELKIVKVPMPPLVSEDLQVYLSRIRTQIFAYVCDEIGISYLRYYQLRPNTPEKNEMLKLVATHLESRFKKELDFSKYSDLDLMARAYLDADLKTLVDTQSDPKTIYRSYLNSLFIRNPQGDSSWLLPRYAPRNEEKAEEFASMEKRVEAAYRSAFPEAVIQWVDSDAMADKLGTIHCTTITVPQVQKSKTATKQLRTKVPAEG
ncbi:MAG: agmatine deiminase family protein, partial [Verrucomicrobiae bacterium]|nr:agmatine deiminase family protein [Verrucomicrobiae bacterium]